MAAFPPACGEGEMAGAAHARIEPGGGITEALADVIAGACRAFFQGGRFAQFSASVGSRFGFEQRGVGAAGGISEARPNEMKDLMHSDQPQGAGFSSEPSFEDDLPSPDESS